MVRIRITEAGRGVNIQGDGREPGTIVDATKQEADYFLARGFGELVKDEPEAEPETATAEPEAETTDERPAARRRRGGSQ